jgi:uncharacterized protein YndB with AHSA1/START domain
MTTEHTIVIDAPPDTILEAFSDAAALATWWLTVHSIVKPRPLGVFAVEWAPTAEKDPVLGRLGGVFYGIVMEFKPGRELFVGNAYWLPPDGEPLGPMALEVSCTEQREAASETVTGTLVRVRQSANDQGERWRRYFQVTGAAWARALESLKDYAERSPDS